MQFPCNTSTYNLNSRPSSVPESAFQFLELLHFSCSNNEIFSFVDVSHPFIYCSTQLCLVMCLFNLHMSHPYYFLLSAYVEHSNSISIILMYLKLGFVSCVESLVINVISFLCSKNKLHNFAWIKVIERMCIVHHLQRKHTKPWKPVTYYNCIGFFFNKKNQDFCNIFTSSNRCIF